ncbi:hypothetical protein [Nocardioides yefusunii]|uniref:DUF4177 domain-containing protein n=1 Tax=Nocardioides yefusunii TaxID=2500546 RepID=A0ABW1R0J2_9ACTN|nr:hypothetical protein [Nocardioides yefusunii]
MPYVVYTHSELRREAPDAQGSRSERLAAALESLEDRGWMLVATPTLADDEGSRFVFHKG